MKTSVEIQVLQLFEQVLSEPFEKRSAWLAAQDQPEALKERVRRLLDAERDAGDFMASPAKSPEALPPEFPKVGERLGNYELLKPLEAGGMGVVYLGRRADDVYDQLVAIKLVRPVHLLAAADFRRQLISRFEDERSILARMSHPNVARILDGGSTATGIPYLVMEYVDGVSLTDYCKENKLDVRARLALLSKVCDGVQEAHRHLIVHRDLKPDNILVGANGEPRLLDFGIAKILEQEPLKSEKGTSLSAMTPAYASPEQVRLEALTTSSDVYSLGVVLYQLIAGIRPYELSGLRPAEAERVVCDSQPELMRAMLGRAPLTDSERKARRAQIGDDVERIVAKAMHKEPARRYVSAQDLADDIRRYLSGEPVHAHPDSRTYRVGKFVRRHRFGVAASAAALIAILVASGAALWQAEQARRAVADTTKINTFLMEVLDASDPFNSGADISLSQAVDEAAAKVGPRFPGRPDLSSQIRFALGYSMTSRYRLDTAEQQLQQARIESAEAFGPEDVKTLKVMEGIAQLRQAQGRNDEAEVLFKQIISSMEAQKLQSNPFYGLVLANQGNFYMGNEDYAQADVLLRQAQVQMQQHPDPEALPADMALMVGNLAYTAHGLGDLERADKLFLQAREAMLKLHPQGSLELASLLNNHAFLVHEMGDPEQAFVLWNQSLAMRKRAFTGDHPMIVTAMTSVATQAIRLKKFDVAIAQSEEAAAMAARLYSEPSAQQVMAVATVAGAKLMAGDFPGAGVALDEGAALVARMTAPEEYLVANIQHIRKELCKRPRVPPVEACRGIEPTDPPLP